MAVKCFHVKKLVSGMIQCQHVKVSLALTLLWKSYAEQLQLGCLRAITVYVRHNIIQCCAPFLDSVCCKLGKLISEFVLAMITLSDVNECDEHGHGCHTNAICTNMDGSFHCQCAENYTGSGVICNREWRKDLIVAGYFIVLHNEYVSLIAVHPPLCDL